MDRIMRFQEVIDTVGLSRSGIYQAQARGEFPPPVQITSKAIGWTESVISDWIEGKIEDSQAQQVAKAI